MNRISVIWKRIEFSGFTLKARKKEKKHYVKKLIIFNLEVSKHKQYDKSVL